MVLACETIGGEIIRMMAFVEQKDALIISESEVSITVLCLLCSNQELFEKHVHNLFRLGII